jgi:dTDP-4-dehydrorhamnose 3,5-epimerase
VTDRFGVGATPLAGVLVLRRHPIEDERGWLARIYDAVDLAEVLGSRTIVQVNHTLTRQRATVRGMHYQVPPAAEVKVVSCLRGSVFDVAVDLRRNSPTFLRWHAEVLDPENGRSLLVPEGVAHGFQALADESELLYLHTAAYDPTAERGVHPMDPRIAVAWPLAVEHLSQRDASHPLLTPDFEGVAA